MIGGATRHMFPHLSGVPLLHITGPSIVLVMGDRFGGLFSLICLLSVLVKLLFFWIACENIRFSSLFAAGDVSRGGYFMEYNISV